MVNELREKKPVDVLLLEYQPWGDAVKVWESIVANNKFEDVKEFFRALCPFPNGLSQYNLNRILSFTICAIGTKDKTREEERAEFDEYLFSDEDLEDLFSSVDELDDNSGDFSESDNVIIADNANNFEDCMTEIKIPNGVQRIGICAFAGRDDLKSITIPDSVISIGECAFWNCICLESVIIPRNVTNIERETFYYCKTLTSITIPKSVTSIERGAFEYCLSLLEIDYEGTKEDWELVKKERCWRKNSGIRTIKCTDGIIKLRKN